MTKSYSHVFESKKDLSEDNQSEVSRPLEEAKEEVEKKEDIPAAKKTLFPDPHKSGLKFAFAKKGDSNLFNKETEPVKPLDDTGKTEKEEPEKPKIPSIFGKSQSAIDELKKNRASNNSSPAFGESRNDTIDDTHEEKPQEKPSSIFVPKSSTIVEKPNEEEESNPVDANQDYAKKIGLFSSKTDDKIPQTSLLKREVSKPIFAMQKRENSIPNLGSKTAASPFLTSPKKLPTNLFGSKDKKEEKPADVKPKTLLFDPKPVTQTTLFGQPKISTGNTFYFMASPNSRSENFSSFDSPVTFGSVSSQNSNSISTVSPFGAQSGSNLQAGDDDDVGMGGVTPPTQSPIQQPSKVSQKFEVVQDTKPAGGPIFGSQSSVLAPFGIQGSGASMTSMRTGGIFGNPIQQTPNPTDKGIFSLGMSRPPTSGQIFNQGIGSGPNQGQPNLGKTNTWSVDPFPNKSRNKRGKNQDDDGLFR
jgi:hypothetical protein